MSKTGRPKKWDDPRTGVLASKKKYRDKKRLERQRTNNTLVISHRCKQCGLEVKVNLMSERNPSICIWCEYDNKTASKRGAGSGKRPTAGR